MSPEFTTGIVVAFVLTAVALVVLFCLHLDARSMIRNLSQNVSDYNSANYTDKQDWRNGQRDLHSQIDNLRDSFETTKERINDNFRLTGERLGEHKDRFRQVEDKCGEMLNRASTAIAEIAAGQRLVQDQVNRTADGFGCRLRALEEEDGRKSETLRQLEERLTEEEDYTGDLREEFEEFKEEALTGETLDSALLGKAVQVPAAAGPSLPSSSYGQTLAPLSIGGGF